eukprot:SAG31_NODE_35459_length_323_cov_0.611607_1_plen_49_part_10
MIAADLQHSQVTAGSGLRTGFFGPATSILVAPHEYTQMSSGCSRIACAF